MKKIFYGYLCALTLSCTFSSCNVEKQITVISREQGSGTREAFDKIVTDGKGNFLEMKDENGKKIYKTTPNADIQKEAGNVLTKVSTDKYAIGYVSLASLNDSVKTVRVNGVAPSVETVLNGSYVLQRPFVIMTTTQTPLTTLTADFLSYLKSNLVKEHVAKSGCVYLSDSAHRANASEPPIPEVEYIPKTTLPYGEKIIINGSTSMEKMIKESMAGYARLYGKKADEIFTLDLQGSSVGKRSVKNDKKGDKIGLSSVAVHEVGIASFNLCLDVIAVIAHKENSAFQNVTLNQLYQIYSGAVTTFGALTVAYE